MNLGTTDLKKQLSKLAESSWQQPVMVSRYGSPWIWIVSHDTWRRRLGTADPVLPDHPLLALRQHVDGELQRRAADILRVANERYQPPPSVTMLRTLILQALYDMESPQALYEQLVYNLLFRDFVGTDIRDVTRDVSTFVETLAAMTRDEQAVSLLEDLLAQAPIGAAAAQSGISADCRLLAVWRNRLAMKQRKVSPPPANRLTQLFLHAGQ